ncbi:unnamed protein product, partial [Choristocarpus tenellus]
MPLSRSAKLLRLAASIVVILGVVGNHYTMRRKKKRSSFNLNRSGIITVSAPGKVLIAGGYLVLERPNVGVVLASTARFYTSIKWINEKPPVASPYTHLEGKSCLRVLVESPQFHSRHWYEIFFNTDGSLPNLLPSAGQDANPYVEHTLVFVLGFLQHHFELQAEDSMGGINTSFWSSLTTDDDDADCSDCSGHRPPNAGYIAIKLRADNDFYSQTTQVRRGG